MPRSAIEVVQANNAAFSAMDVDAMLELFAPDAVPDSPFEVVTVVDLPKWREKALWWPEREALVIAEAVGSGPTFGDPAGIHVFLRLRPPGALRDHDPVHLLFGHGTGVHGAAAKPALERAYRRSLRDLPLMLARLPLSARG